MRMSHVVVVQGVQPGSGYMSPAAHSLMRATRVTRVKQLQQVPYDPIPARSFVRTTPPLVIDPHAGDSYGRRTINVTPQAISQRDPHR